jgi:hypothetical protein
MATTLTKKEELLLISQIAKRAKRAGNPDDLITINMDIEAAHKEAPLDLQALLAADDFNFNHDVFGIRKYMDRTTGKLTNCFSPRFTAH